MHYSCSNIWCLHYRELCKTQKIECFRQSSLEKFEYFSLFQTSQQIERLFKLLFKKIKIIKKIQEKDIDTFLYLKNTKRVCLNKYTLRNG